MVVQTYRRFGTDFESIKSEAEFDASANLRFINGKKLPYIVRMSTAHGKVHKDSICFLAEVIIFDNQLERDLVALHQQNEFKINFYKLNEN